MIVILEGPDGAGKSTLAEQLRKEFERDRITHVTKHGPYNGVDAADLCRIFFRAMTSALTYDEHLIMDRSWISEPIYADVYRNGVNRVDLQRRRMLERVALSRGGVIVHCQPAFELCEKAFLSRKDAEYLDTTQQLQKVYSEYMSMGQNSALPLLHYDYEHDNVDDLVDDIFEQSIENFAAGGGCFKKGNTLLLCDKGPRTNVRASAVVVPFINFLDNDGPSRMLCTALEQDGLYEQDLYWINTQTQQGTGASPDFIAQLQPKRVFALGNNAFTWALNNNVSAIKLPPPLHHMQNYADQPYTILGAINGNQRN